MNGLIVIEACHNFVVHLSSSSHYRIRHPDMANPASGHFIVKFQAFSILMSSGLPHLQYPLPSKVLAVVVTEGIPPVACWLVEKIRKWEYVNLLKDHSSSEQFVVVNGQVVPIQSGQKPQSPKTITNILSWLQAFSVLSAILLSSAETSKEEAAGLAAHSCLILHMSKDLQGPQWLHCDQNFRKWAVAKNIRKWRELNFTIYGHCLAAQQPHPPVFPAKQKREG